MTDEMSGRDRDTDDGADDQQTLEDLVEARLALLAAAYPALVTGESHELIRSEIERAIARDDRLRRFPLGNADEPMALFRPYRSLEPENDA